jgi:hypothetical protein
MGRFPEICGLRTFGFAAELGLRSADASRAVPRRISISRIQAVNVAVHPRVPLLNPINKPHGSKGPPYAVTRPLQTPE